MNKILLVLLLCPIVSALTLNSVDCPDEIIVNEDFYCSLNISDVNGLFDVKFQIVGTNSTINKVWNNAWQRSDWYINGLINKNDEYKIKNIIADYIGDATIKLRIRESGSSSFLIDRNIPIKIEVREEETKNEDSEEEIETETQKENEKEIEKKQKTIENTTKVYSSQTIINLNSNKSSEKIVYEARSRKIKKILLFLSIAVFVIILFFQLVKYGKRNNDNGDAWET